jgi:flagellar basal-body rod modification protein FlgD
VIASATGGVPSGSTVFGAQAGGQMGKEEFLQLLVAQLRHQDPLSPMDGQQFAAQLAQFTSVEQLMVMNARMAEQQRFDEAMAQAMNSSAAIGALGRDVVAVGSQLQVTGGEGDAVLVEVGGLGGNAVLRIYDATGREVGTREVGAVGPGRQRIEVGEAAEGLEPGVYSYALEVTDGQGRSVEVTTFIAGRVDGVRYTAEGPVLVCGPLEIPLGHVLEVSKAD